MAHPVDKVAGTTSANSHPALISGIRDAAEIAYRYAGIDGEHHKQWVIDQMLQCILGADAYAEFIESYNAEEEDGEKYDDWDPGIAP